MYDCIKMHPYRKYDLFVLSSVTIIVCLPVIGTVSSQCIRRNLAYGQVASQSSTEHQATANLAIDGNESSFSSTILSENPYWLLTFEEPVQVEDLTIQLYISEISFSKSMKPPETLSIKTSSDLRTFALEETIELKGNGTFVNYQPTVLFSITSKIVKAIKIEVNETGKTVLRILEVKAYGPQKTPISMQNHPFAPSFSILLANVMAFPASYRHNLREIPAKVEVDVHFTTYSEERIYHSSNFIVPGYTGRQIMYSYNHTVITIAIVSAAGESLKGALPLGVYIRVRAWREDDFPSPIYNTYWDAVNITSDTMLIRSAIDRTVLPDLVVVQVYDNNTGYVIEGKGYQSIWSCVNSGLLVRDVVFGFSISAVEITLRKAPAALDASCVSASSATGHVKYRIMAWTFDRGTLHSITTFEKWRFSSIVPYYFHLNWVFSTFMVSDGDSEMLFYGMGITGENLPLSYTVYQTSFMGQRTIRISSNTLPVTLNVSVTTWVFLKTEDCICSTEDLNTSNSTYEGQNLRYNRLGDSAPFTCEKNADTYVRGTCGKDCKWHVPYCRADFCDESKLLADNAEHKVQGKGLKWVKYECKEGYVLSDGNLVRVCQSNGKWSGEKPSCSRVVCPLNQIKMEEAYYNITGNTVNDVVVYTCKSGYRMAGGNNTRVCQQSGSWSGQTPICDVTSEGLSAIKKDLETKLLFNKTNTTLHKLQKISVYEKRVGAVSLGTLGIFILIVTLLVIIVPDVSRIYNDFQTLDGHKRPKQMIRTTVFAKTILEHRISAKQK